MRRLAAVAAAALCAAPVWGEVKTKLVEYKDGGTVLEGFAAWDDAVPGKKPGVLVAHDWLGQGPYAQRRAKMLAEMGYVAFALDMYGKGKFTTDHAEAGKLAGAVSSDREQMRRRAALALAELKKMPGVDAGRLAAIGYCFGGTTVLELAREGADIKGAVSFHGNLATPTPAAKTPKAKILVFQGGDDTHTLSGLPGFEDEMRQVKADWQVVVYGGAVHGFTVPEAGNDPSKGMAYDQKADQRSWKAMQDFFAEIFR